MNEFHNPPDLEASAADDGVSPSVEPPPAPLDEDFSIHVPDPSGPPSPVGRVKSGLNVLAGAAIVLAAGAGTAHLVGGSMNSCRGATVSARLQWEQRQAEIRQVLAERQADQQAAQTKSDAQANEEATDDIGGQR